MTISILTKETFHTGTENRILREEHLKAFEGRLQMDEKSAATIEKYMRDVRAFGRFTENRPVTKELVMEYKEQLIKKGYAIRSINSMLASLSGLFSHLGWQDCRVKSLKLQRQIYCPEEKELTRAEYFRLLEVAGKDTRLHLILQTICSVGIRVSELSYFTVEAVMQGEVKVSCKGKARMILLPGKLRKALLSFAKRKGVIEGAIFRTRNGNPIDRSNLWTEMKRLCKRAGVESSKVFPHNLRKLFARTFYRAEKDIAKLADLLGHSNINTTRIYIMSTGAEHRKRLEKLGLVV